jgi:hypothetical protein
MTTQEDSHHRFTLRVEKSLWEKFNKKCVRQERPARWIIEKLMRDFIKAKKTTAQ